MRISTHFAKIIVEGSIDRPFFSILYYDPSSNKYYKSFGSHDLNFVWDQLNGNFKIIDSPNPLFMYPTIPKTFIHKDVEKFDDVRRYVINYGYGVAYFTTPFEPINRFYTLANQCFGIRKSITKCEIEGIEDYLSEPDYERLVFGGDSYIWRRDGARKMLTPFEDEEWDTSFCDVCAFKGVKHGD